MVAALGMTRLILVEKLDRVARAVLIQELIIMDLAKREVSLTTAAGDDATDEAPERVMFRQLLGIFAQYERATLTLKLRGARQRKKEACGNCGRPREQHEDGLCALYVTGRCEGRKPYGAKGSEAATLEAMRVSRREGLTFEGIAAELNAAGLVTRYGQAWRGGTIRKILARDGVVVAA